ncbi:MAG TPA: aromatic amino acid DMT transporter YddG [Phycisphaerae bacterium]|nr:aromatic amino acid DMT transporter YddG [Phycisphaerae bacterium]
MDTLRSRRINTALGIVAIVLWSSTMALARSLSEALGPLTAGTIVYTAGGVLGCLYLAARGRLVAAFRLPRAYLVGSGLLFVAYIVCMYLAVGLAVSRQQTIEVGILNYLWPALTLVFAIPILHARVRAAFWPGVVLGLAGAALAPLRLEEYSLDALAANLRAHPVPYLLALAAAILWGLYSNVSRRWAGQARGGAVPVFVLVTGLVLAALRWAFPEESVWTARAMAELAFLAVFPTLLAYAMWDAAVRRGNLTLVASVSYLAPLLSTAISAVYLDVAVGWNLWAACGLVVAGALVCSRSVVRCRPRQAAAYPR